MFALTIENTSDPIVHRDDFLKKDLILLFGSLDDANVARKEIELELNTKVNIVRFKNQFTIKNYRVTFSPLGINMEDVDENEFKKLKQRIEEF